MRKREYRAPLQEELPVFTEFAALRACVSKTGPWHDGLQAPALGRPEAAQPPAAPPKWLSQSGYARAQDDLMWNTLLGSADARLWVTFAKEEEAEIAAGAGAREQQEAAASAAEGEKDHSGMKRRFNTGAHSRFSGFSEVANVRAFLCHKSLLGSSSPLLRHKLQEAEIWNREQRTEHARAKAAKKKDQARPTVRKAPTMLGEMKKMNPLVEIEITVHECGEAFSEVMDWIYGKPLQLTSHELKITADRGWWPLLSLAQDLQILELEDMLRTPLMELTGASSNYMWSLLHLCAAHRLEPEIVRCCDHLTRIGGKGALALENKLPDLPLEVLTALMASQAWVVNEELEIYFILLHWMSGQPWYQACTKKRGEDDEEEPEKVPQEVAEAAGSWGIRWAFLPREFVEKFAEIGLVPPQLADDCERWRFTARVRPPPLPRGEEWGHLDKSMTLSSLKMAETGPASQQQQRSPPATASQSRRGSLELEAETISGDFEKAVMAEDQEAESAAAAERGSVLKFDLWKNKGVVIVSTDKARSMYGFPESLNDVEADSVKLVLETQMPPGDPVPISPGTTLWRNSGALLSQQSKVASDFLSGTRKLCERADERFGLQRKSQTEAELSRAFSFSGEAHEQALIKARRVASKHLEFVNCYSPWMNRRRCFVRKFKLPDDYEEFFPTVFEDQDALVLICRAGDPTGRSLHLAHQKEEDIQASRSLALQREGEHDEFESEQDADLMAELMGRNVEKELDNMGSMEAAMLRHPVQAPKQQQPATRSPRVVHAGTGAADLLASKVAAHPGAKARADRTKGRSGGHAAPQAPPVADDGQRQRQSPTAPSTEAPSMASETTRLVGLPALKGGRHEVLLRILIRRSRTGPGTKRRLAAPSVATALSKAFRLGLSVYSGGSEGSTKNRDTAGTPGNKSLPSREMGSSVPGPAGSRGGNESEVAMERCAKEPLAKALAKSFGQLSSLEVGGLIDVTILMVLDLSTQEQRLRYAVEAVMASPYCQAFADEESEDCTVSLDKQELTKDSLSQEAASAAASLAAGASIASAGSGGPQNAEPDAKQVSSTSSSAAVSFAGAPAEADAGDKKLSRLVRSKRSSTTPIVEKLPSMPMNFLQDRKFLRTWHCEELLMKDLKPGLNLSKMALSAAGSKPRFAPVIEVTPALLTSIGGAGSQARLEILPHAALRPDWWVQRMGGTADMPRSAIGEEASKGWQM
eukprot:TRINITY_DN26508_c0_g1_i1.p1 TRINITY_DN26508_c0_g1~~TRINITY_DN26508_c0_g1_i1.p1  ORF type:complete len:1214 (-),score=281.76 TRINITY_DN26508_c0_g1_i1:54-3695(-)